MIYLRLIQFGVACFCMTGFISAFIHGDNEGMTYAGGGLVVISIYLIFGIVEDRRKRERVRCRKILEEIEIREDAE